MQRQMGGKVIITFPEVSGCTSSERRERERESCLAFCRSRCCAADATRLLFALVWLGKHLPSSTGHIRGHLMLRTPSCVPSPMYITIPLLHALQDIVDHPGQSPVRLENNMPDSIGRLSSMLATVRRTQRCRVTAGERLVVDENLMLSCICSKRYPLMTLIDTPMASRLGRVQGQINVGGRLKAAAHNE